MTITDDGIRLSAVLEEPEEKTGRIVILLHGFTSAKDRLHTLQAANPTLDLDNLKPGDVVCVPSLNLPCALPGSAVMAQGDTLESLAAKYRLSVAQVLRANPCLAPDDFTEGTTVKLPQ